ncbi:MAG: hypothetical protein ABI211_14230 [Vicinamibacterales bacterium]
MGNESAAPPSSQCGDPESDAAEQQRGRLRHVGVLGVDEAFAGETAVDRAPTE